MRVSENEFRRLVEKHKAVVFSIALRIVGEREAAEEVAQDVFLALYAAVKRLESEDHVISWLRRVAIHRATDCVRRRIRRPEFRAEEWREDGQITVPANSHAPAAMEALLEKLLLSIPETLRSAVVLRYQEDLEPEEIAQVLGQPVATVRSNLHRAIDLLRRKSAVVMKEFMSETVRR